MGSIFAHRHLEHTPTLPRTAGPQPTVARKARRNSDVGLGSPSVFHHTALDLRSVQPGTPRSNAPSPKSLSLGSGLGQSVPPGAGRPPSNSSTPAGGLTLTIALLSSASIGPFWLPHGAPAWGSPSIYNQAHYASSASLNPRYKDQFKVLHSLLV